MAGRDVGRIGRALYAALPRTECIPRGAFVALLPRGLAVQLHQLRIVNIATERALNGLQVRPMAVRGQLDAVRQPGAQVVHESNRVLAVAPAHQP